MAPEPRQRQRYAGKHVGARPRRRRLALLLAAIAAAAAVVVLAVSLPGLMRRDAPQAQLPPVAQPAAPRQMLVYLQELHDQNPDVVGYLKIEGTRIDGPVMHTPGEDRYLHTGFDGQELYAGCLYVDKYNSTAPRDDNLIIHGHNMNDGSMLHDLLEYKDQTFWEQHKTIRFDSLYEAAEYQVVAAFVSQVYYPDDDVFKYYRQYDFATQADFDYFMDNIKALSLYDTGVEAQLGDEFITLSTCEYSREDGRMVVVARKIGHGQAEEPMDSTAATHAAQTTEPLRLRGVIASRMPKEG